MLTRKLNRFHHGIEIIGTFFRFRCPFYIILFDLFPLIYPFAFSSLIILQFISLVKMIQLRFSIINE